MPTLVGVAAAIVAAGGQLQAAAPPIGSLRYGGLVYDVRAVYRGAGLSGQPPYCAERGDELVMVVYTVRNGGPDGLSGPAVPRVTLFDPRGRPTEPDRRRTEALAFKISPPMTLRHGRLERGEIRVLADIFSVPRGDIDDGTWKIRPGRSGADTGIIIPQPRTSQSAECDR
ncbi:hypothetical protein ACO2Q0_04415 [Phenylobacterium sp. VNQ135]|uniref:hypothetical protein n=1 Tax=Phenylobacterium sp. VNQ135 TaxID=3400922 RepID=UPI003C09DEC6